jgi:hypothetical protein
LNQKERCLGISNFIMITKMSGFGIPRCVKPWFCKNNPKP